jgi:glutaredoxin 3
MDGTLKLYVKVWCPWCVAAKRYLDERGFEYDEIDVERDRSGYAEMVRISGQSYTPTLEVDGKVLPDFGPDELELFLEKHSIAP